MYCLGIDADTRRNIKTIYDFKTGCVKTECLHNGWITSGSAKVVRMAFNLYNISKEKGIQEVMKWQLTIARIVDAAIKGTESYIRHMELSRQQSERRACNWKSTKSFPVIFAETFALPL